MKNFLVFFLLLVTSSTLFSQIKIDVSTDKLEYHYRDSIRIFVTATNSSTESIILSWGSSCQASYEVINEYNWTNDHTCVHILTGLTLEPNQSQTWSFTYKNHLLKPGHHKIIGEVLGYGKSDTLEIFITDSVIAYYSTTVKNNANQPIQNVFVSSQGAESTITNAQGKFTLEFTSLIYPPGPPIAYPDVNYSHPDYQPYTEIIMLSEGDSITGPDVILNNKITIQGKVKYENGEPAQNCNVYMFSSKNYYSAVSDFEGNYSMQCSPGFYYLNATLYYHYGYTWTYRMSYFNNKPKLADADLIEIKDTITVVDFIFPFLEIGTISGRVIDAATQQPLFNSFISASSQEPRDSLFSGCDENGNYTIEVFEGSYNISAYDDGYYWQFYDNAYSTFDATPITVSKDSLNIEGIDFSLINPEPGSNSISGFVRDKNTNSEMFGVEVYAVPLAGENWVKSTTGYDGKYLLKDLKNGDYIILFYKENCISQFYKNYYETCSDWEDAFIFSLSGGKIISYLFTELSPINPYGGEVMGKIYTDLNSSMSGTLISAVDSVGNTVSSSISVYNGSYLIPSLKNGSYSIKASKIGFHTSEYAGKININLDNKPVVDGVNIYITLTDAKENGNTIPTSYTLSQNYPNPFNPSTKIKYSIPNVGTQHALSVQLKVYDVLGNEIATLVNEEKQTGNYEVEFNADLGAYGDSPLPSGVYFYSLKAGDYFQTKKMILMK